MAPVRILRTLSSSPQRVFDAFLDPVMIRAWFAPGDGEIIRVDVKPQVGGTFSVIRRRGDVYIDTRGTFRVIDRPRRLVFSWASPPALDGQVTVEIEPDATAGSAISLTHELGRGTGHPAEIEAAWMRSLDAMADALGYPASDDPSIDEAGHLTPHI